MPKNDQNFLQDPMNSQVQTRKPMPAKYFNEDSETQVHPASVTISKPVSEVWSFIRDLTNMPKFIRGLQSIQIISPKVSHWVFAHDGQTEEHDSEIIADEMGSLFAWRAIGDRNMVGVVTLEAAPGGRGTMVSMRTTADHEAGKVMGVLNYYFGKDSKTSSYVNLRRLKAYMETGEVPTVEGQPSGRDEDNNLNKQ